MQGYYFLKMQKVLFVLYIGLCYHKYCKIHILHIDFKIKVVYNNCSIQYIINSKSFFLWLPLSLYLFDEEEKIKKKTSFPSFQLCMHVHVHVPDHHFAKCVCVYIYIIL